MSSSPLKTILENLYFCVIVVLVKMCLGVLEGIAYIGSFAKPLLILIWGEGFSNCMPYILVILIDLITIHIWGGGINWSHQHSILPVVTHKLNILKLMIFKK